MRGDHVILEPLDMSHVDDLYAATDDPEVWQYTSTPRPRSRDEMAAIVAGALAAWHRGERVPWVQRSARTGEVVGTTSLREPGRGGPVPGDRIHRARQAVVAHRVNTEAKLLLLTRAFEELGAVRVEWHTDMRNERARRSLERLGAVWEGVRRSYRRRADGSPRNSVLYAMTADDWAAAKARLTG